MALIRRDPARSEISSANKGIDLETAREGLLSGDAEGRWQAARLLGDTSGTTGVLGEGLAVESDLRVREAILTSLVRQGGRDAATVLLPYLRSEDAGLRGGAIEALQTMPAAVLPEMPALLADPDPDVRLLATELARTMPVEVATDLLCRTLDVEVHPNVSGAVVEVLADIGTLAATSALRRAKERFASDPFLPLAIEVVLGRFAAESGTNRTLDG